MGTELTNLVVPSDKNLVTDSETIARVFNKPHKHVLRAIEELVKRNAQGYQPKIGLIPSDKDIAVDRRRKFGEGAGKLISEPIYTYEPTAYDLLVAQSNAMDAERKKNELDTDKCQFFRLTTYECVE